MKQVKIIFGEISIPEAKQYLKEKGIPVKI
jgi:hypothetical protein